MTSRAVEVGAIDLFAVGHRSDSNDAIVAKVRSVIAGGGSSNMRNAGYPRPLAVSAAEGCRITDVEGNTLIDLNMGYGPHLFGYRDPEVLREIADQLLVASMTGLPNELDYHAGSLIATIVPSIERLRFANSGTEAVMSALRLARMSTGRPLVVTFEGHYHGWSESVLRAPVSAALDRVHGPRRPRPGALGMAPNALDATIELPFNDRSALDAIFAERGHDIAAVILEPICANAGVVLPAPGYLEHVAEVAHGHGAILIFDEVITGFRVAAGGAQEVYNVRPDLTILSKALGGGFPVAAFGGTCSLMEPLATNTAFHAGVYAGNHTAMRAVAATLTKLLSHPELYEVLEERSSELEDHVRALFSRLGVPTRIVRAGSIMSVAILKEKDARDERLDSCADIIDFDSHQRWQIECQRRGVYFHPNPLEPWFLSSAHTRADVVDVIAVMNEAAVSAGLQHWP